MLGRLIGQRRRVDASEHDAQPRARNVSAAAYAHVAVAVIAEMPTRSASTEAASNGVTPASIRESCVSGASLRVSAPRYSRTGGAIGTRPEKGIGGKSRRILTSEPIRSHAANVGAMDRVVDRSGTITNENATTGNAAM